MQKLRTNYTGDELCWLSEHVEKAGETGADLFGILWRGNCYAFSKSEQVPYWSDLQDILCELAGRQKATTQARR